MPIAAGRRLGPAERVAPLGAGGLRAGTARRAPRSLARAALACAASALALAGAACRRDPAAPRDLGTRALVVGIDGADWKLVDALAAQGRMPHLARLRAAGVSGPLETLHDVALSPVIRTSIATGKTTAKHGISWFLVDRPDGTRVPVQSTNRKAKALWNVVAEHGRRPVAVGWWATYPAEEVGRGAIVSDALGFHGFGAAARDADPRRKTWPPELLAAVDPLLPPEQQVPYEFVARFAQLAPEAYRREMFDPGRFPHRDPFHPIHLFQQAAVTAQGYTAIAERLLAERPFDLFLVYYEQIDSLSHLHRKHAPPQLDWVGAREVERYRDLVSEWYAYQDELLGRLLARVDLDETAVFVVSDHGFKSGERRIRGEATVDARRAHLEHEPHGILLAAGPHLGRGERIDGASVLDLAPTLLHYLGFAVAKDMDGKVLARVFEKQWWAEHPIRYLATYEDPTPPAPGPAAAAGIPAPADERALADSEERERALAALGDLAGGAPAPARGTPGAEASSPEQHNNLGRIHLRDGDLERAEREFGRALALDPENSEALLDLAALQRARGNVALAEQTVERALRVDPASAGALAQLAALRRERGDLAAALRLFREALAIDDSQPGLHLGYGDVLQRAGRYAEAEREFRAVLALDPDSFQARYNLGVTFANQGRRAEAERWYREALAKAPEHPEAAKALNNLGYLALEAGATDAAIGWFERAVAAGGAHLESRYNLGVQYLLQGRIDEAIRLLEAAAELAPNHEQVHEKLGLADLEANRAGDAYRTLLLVRRLYSENWFAPLGLAVVHAAAGDAEHAQPLLAEAFRLGGAEARRRAAAYPALAGLGGGVRRRGSSGSIAGVVCAIPEAFGSARSRWFPCGAQAVASRGRRAQLHAPVPSSGRQPLTSQKQKVSSSLSK